MLRRALDWYTRTYAVWVIAFGLIAYVFPAPFLLVGPWMPWFFALTMFGIGVALDPHGFVYIARHPWIVGVGSAAQFIIMPFGAFALCRVFRLPDEIALGLILTGSAPGAMASNVMCYIAKADTAYSVSLTTVSTLLCPLLTPSLCLLLAGAQMEVPFLGMVNTVCQTVVGPLLLGFAARHYFHRRIEKALPLFPAISTTFIILICAFVIAANRGYLPKVTVSVLVAIVILNLYGMLGGYGTAWLFRMERRRRKTLCIEIGMQNAGLGTVLALKHFSERAALPAALFVFVCIITASLLPALWARGDQALLSEEGVSP
jgi:bile acid:Na+ symporter, BASS family